MSSTARIGKEPSGSETGTLVLVNETFAPVVVAKSAEVVQ
jgi:hypothetical protein